MRMLYVLGATAVVLSLAGAKDSFADPALLVDVSGVCYTFDGNGNPVLANTGKVIASNNENGNVTLKCKVEGVTPPPDGNAVRWTSENTIYACVTIGVPYQVTYQWWAEVTPSGISTITCQFPQAPGY